jgi:hypothetical protein
MSGKRRNFTTENTEEPQSAQRVRGKIQRLIFFGAGKRRAQDDKFGKFGRCEKGKKR